MVPVLYYNNTLVSLPHKQSRDVLSTADRYACRVTSFFLTLVVAPPPEEICVQGYRGAVGRLVGEGWGSQRMYVSCVVIASQVSFELQAGEKYKSTSSDDTLFAACSRCVCSSINSTTRHGRVPRRSTSTPSPFLLIVLADRTCACASMPACCAAHVLAAA